MATYASNAVTYVGSFDEDGTVVDYEEVLRDDWTTTEEQVRHLEGGTNERSIETDRGAGTGREDFELVYDDVLYRTGSGEWDLDGTVRYEWLTEFETGTTYEVEYERDFFGDGEGTKEATASGGDTYSCDLVYEAFVCTQDCDLDDADGECHL